MRCGYCGSREHPIRLCPRTWAGQAALMHLRCGYCGGKHEQKNCPRLAYCGYCGGKHDIEYCPRL